ncbi:pilus assembly protein CpaD [Mesorhizobium sp. NBSH29]|uniref:CpaD family pilus assembly protein n=1 Tax=Mesorhizobium sp. NBSH29 TaxID=2654249 RepID=UPI0018969231|nr:CpaD family pilus assembly protein [Mesorhizobium sp. NBSH29]QPC86552.1 pilus assembly protein CpaD [Mesorhizobium sp. NBSH29]
MSDTMKSSAGRTARSASLLAIFAVVLLAGCAKRDSITVGSVPDDYRTNHPIVIAEKEETLDLPVGISDRGMTKPQQVSLEGFLANYDRSAAPVLRILVPEGSANASAASHAAGDFARFAKQTGVPASRVAILSYQGGSADTSAPIRVAFSAMRAQTGKCGRWPEDIANTEENKHYANFGCSYQNNLAAQIANPADLLGPRKPSPIDAGRRGVAIDGYRNAPYYHAVPAQEVEY